MANEVKIEISLDEKQALKALGRLQKEVDESASSTTKAFKKIDMAVASFAGNLAANLANKAIGAFTNAISVATDSAIDFEKAVTEVNTLLPQSAKLTQGLKNDLIDLSTQFGVDKADQARAYYQIISSGAATGKEAVELLNQANVLARAGLADLGDSVNIITDIINIYGAENLSAAEASDILFQTVKLGKTTVAELSTSIGLVLPAAQRLGIGLDQVGASLATLTTQGLSTSQRVTQLNALFTALFKKGGDADKKFGKEVGDAFSITALRAKGLQEFLEDLITATNGNEETLVQLLGRNEAAQAVFGLTGQAAKSLTKNLNDMANATNAANKAAKENADTFSNQWDQAVTKVTNIIGKGISPLLEDATFFLKGFNKEQKETSFDELKRLNKEIENYQGKINKLQSMKERGIQLRSTDLSRLEQYKNQLAELNKEKDDFNRGIQKAAKDAERNRNKALGVEDSESGSVDKMTESERIAAQKAVEINREKNSILKKLSEERIAAENELATLQAEAMKEGRQADLETRQEEYALEKEIKLLQDEEKIAQEAKTKEELANLDMKFKGEQLKRDLDANKKKEKLDKEAADKKKKLDEQAKQAYFATKQAEINIAANAAGLITAVSGKETKAAFLISKAAAAAQVVIDTQVANMLASRQLGVYAAPVIAKQTIAGAIALGTIAATTLQGFADGGVVGGGATTGGDNRTITARDGEMILNADQQANLFNGINSGGMGGDIVIEIDGREIARAVRDQRQQGFSV